MKNAVTKRTHKATNIQKVFKEVLAYLFVGLMLVAGCTKLRAKSNNHQIDSSTDLYASPETGIENEFSKRDSGDAVDGITELSNPVIDATVDDSKIKISTPTFDENLYANCETTTIYYADRDGDGQGDPKAVIEACLAEPGFVEQAGDCDDSCASCFTGGTETCGNGKDENCDGSIDEGCPCSPGEKKPCGLDEGECKTGIQTCVEGQWGECSNAVGESEEICDNLDNDCDGETDEVPGHRCGTDVGLCEFGIEICTNGMWNCLPGVEPFFEVCDVQKLDEDCDGLINEDCQCSKGDTLPCGTDEGICYYGKQRCINGYFSNTCENEGRPDPRGEICDGTGRDEDCDGKTDIGDEDCDCINGDVEKCEERLYVCSPGTKTCINGKWGSCIGVQNGSFEVCNGIDDDCDGITDEAPSLLTPICGVGETCENGRCVYGGVVNPYMVSIDTRVSPSRLLKIDLATGAGTRVCELPSPFDTYGYNSVAFDTEGQLIMSNYTNYSIDRMDPCTCTVSEVGNTGFTNIPGLTVDGDGNIYGIEMSSNTLLKIDPESGEGTSIGSLGITSRSTGLTWDAHHDREGYDLYAISSYDNALYGINSQTGLATLVSKITGVTFSGVGVEIHQTTGELYGCTTNAILYKLNKETGVAIAIGSGMGHSSDCNNLAAPLGPIPCLDQF